MRKVVVHKKQRDKRLSRYQFLNWAFTAGREMKKIRDYDKLNQTMSKNLLFTYQYSADLAVIAFKIWLTYFDLEVSPTKLKNFDEFHNKCGHLCCGTRQYYFHQVKTKIEYLTRTKKERVEIEYYVRKYLNDTVGYSPMSESEYVELKQAIKNHLTDVKYNPLLTNTTFTIDAWKMKRHNDMLDRVYGTDLPE